MALPYATEDQLKILERKTKDDLDRKTANINLTANTMEDMNALIASGSVNDGQLCYLKEDKKLYVLKDGKWEEVGGSTSPILNLLDWSSEDPAVRTSITEEEKQNIEKGLYNSVLYIDASLGDASFYSIYFSEPASYINGMFIFSIYKFSLDETTESGSITSLRGYGLNIGEKNPDETYPITIESLMEIPFGSGSSNLPIVKKATNNKVTITEDEFDKLASGNYSLSVFSTNSSGFTSSLIFTDVAVNALSEGKPDNIRAISSSIVFNDPIIVQQDYRLNFSRNNLVSDITSSFTPMTQSKLLNKKVMTYGTFTSENLLPCTTADNGKVLSVVDGEAQWASAGGGTSIQSVDAYGEGGTTTIERGKISTDLTGVELKVPFVLNIYEDSTLSGTPMRIVMTNKFGEIYFGNFDFIDHYLVQMTKGTDGKYSYASSIVPNATENTLFNKPILVPENLVDPTPILPCTASDNGKVLSVVNGEAQWATPTGGGGGTKLYQHNIVLLENSISEYLYIKHISSKQSEVTSIADLNTLLGTGTYTFGCSGEVKINNTWHNAVAIYWDGAYAKSLVMYNVPSEGEKTASLTIYTGVTDTVTPV